MVRASIVMATYNGERFLKEQIDSILFNLGESDELVISDDGSQDETIEIIEQFQQKDDRIKLLPSGTHKGVVRNFENAIKNARGKYIFLADQDDIWVEGKVEKVVTIFENNPDITCVLHDLIIIDENGQTIAPSFSRLRNVHLGFMRNICKNSYIGNAMAFRRTLLKYVLPIPSQVPMHDQWIGLLSEYYGRTYLDPDPLGLYRRHDGNVTEMVHGTFSEMIKKRIKLLITLFNRIVYRR